MASMRLLSPIELGALTLPNRVVMAPMTRARATQTGVPNPKAAEYYAQRASAGLIISEGATVSRQGTGYVRTPGIYSAEQVGAWARVSRAVHEHGGRIFLQLWHVGRISHPDLTGGEPPVAPSAIAADAECFTADGPTKAAAPRELAKHELQDIVEQFERAAHNAKAAGFDGVELHGANGYLLDQFLRDGANRRTDAYGGSAANRARLPVEVTRAVIDVWGAQRVGYRISPHFSGSSMSDSNPFETYSVLSRSLSQLGMAYLHLIEPIAGPQAIPPAQRLGPRLRECFGGVLMLNGSYLASTAESALARGDADFISFGVPYIANPDLVERFADSAPLAAPDSATLYAGEEKGYADYSRMQRAARTG